MSHVPLQQAEPLPLPKGVAIDAERIVSEVFPDISLRTRRTWDASGKCPRGFVPSGARRKLWLREHLALWAGWGMPGRQEFERRLKALPDKG